SSCFHRGSYIELSSGAMRRVEDIRTEDFIQSALRSQMFDLREATVVRIDRGAAPGQGVTITFSYDTQHDKVHMEVLPGHPLFVYGQGWASCNPQLSMQLYELKCQQLQVGDICLSLVQREQLAPPPLVPPVPPHPRAVPPRQPVEYNPPTGAMPPAFEHPYQVYAKMANFVAAYTQHMIKQLQD
ncbi:hypothetical protein KR032_002482, partial [Drosophila birchii]